MKPTDDLLRAIASIQGTHQGRVIREYLEGLLSFFNKMESYKTQTNTRNQLSGRCQQLYELIDLFDTSVEKLNKRSNTKKNPS